MALNQEQMFLINHMNNSARNVQLGTQLHRAAQCYKAKWDFAVQGGTIGTINLDDDSAQGDLANPNSTNDLTIPNKFIVYGGFMDIVTTFVGATATIAVGLNTTTDLKAATAVASYAAGLLAIIPVATVATAVKATADRVPTITIATANLTAGKMFVHLVGQLGD